jgi:hypothetical protein
MAADQADSPAISDPVRRFAQRLKAALKADSTADAVRLFMDGVAHELVPDRPDLARWLVKVVGRTEMLRLARAFALRECFYCKGGLERCESCDGRGYHGDQTICERCMGLGVATCDFCTGSGWVTYNYMPAGLRMPVILERVKAASSKAKALLRKATPGIPEQSSRETGKVLAKDLVQLNRLLGVFDNAITAGDKLSAQGAESGPGMQKLLTSCQHAARRLEPRMRHVLRALGDVARLESTRAARPGARAVAARRAKFYDALAASENFLGSGLHHPHLAQQREPPKPSATRSPPAERRPDLPG